MARWIIEKDFGGTDFIVCNACNYSMNSEYYFEPWHFKYCPYCGEFMDNHGEHEILFDVTNMLQAVLDFPIRLDHYDKENGNEHFVLGIESVMEYVESPPSVEPKIYGNEHNCIMTIFGECSYSETGCGSCAVVEKVRDALAKTQMKTQNSNENSNEDAISRADTIKAMCADCEAFFGDDTNCADCDNVAVVKSMPPVESERPKGEWERISFPDGEVMECTNCGYRDWVDVWEEESRNFCPNCGADMRGDTE